MYKSFFLLLVLTVVSISSLKAIEKDIVSHLPVNSELIKCANNSVAVRFTAGMPKLLLEDYEVRVYRFKTFERLDGNSVIDSNNMIFTAKKVFGCNKLLLAVVAKKDEKISKRSYKSYHHWFFSTKQEYDKEYLAHVNNIDTISPFAFENTILKGLDSEVLSNAVSSKRGASSQTGSYQVAPGVEDRELGKMAGLINQKRWAEAETEGLRLFDKYSGSAKFNFYLGLAYANQGKLDDATAAYDRVLIMEPEHKRARLELAKVLLLLKQLDESQKEFETVLASKDLPENVRKNIEFFLNEIDKQRKRATVMFIVTGELKQEIKEENKEAGTEKYNDTIHQEIFITSYTYDFGKFGGWKSANNLVVMNNDKFACSGGDSEDDDAHCRSGVQGYIISLGANGPLQYGNLGVTLSKPDLTAYTNSNGKKKSVGVDGLDLKLSYDYKLRKDLDFLFDVTRKDGTTIMDDLNLADKIAKGYIYNLGLSQKLGANKLGTKYSYEDIKEETDGNSDDYEDIVSDTLEFSYMHSFNKKMSLNSIFSYTNEESDNNIDDNSDYKEYGKNFNFKFSYKYKPTLILSSAITFDNANKSFTKATDKNDESSQGNNITLGVMYIFAPIKY